MPQPQPEKKTVQYFAVSVLSSRTLWFNAAALVVAILSITEVVVLIPPRFLPIASAVVAVCNIVLRMGTVRPVAMIAPGETKVVDVKKIGPPKPPIVTD